MKYYLLDKNDISEVKGIKTEKEIMREFGLTYKEFARIVRSGEPHNGCIILKCDYEDCRELVTSETEELYQLIGESEKGFRYYATSRLRIVSKNPFNGKERELAVINGFVQCKLGNKKRHFSVLRECYKAFIGDVSENEIVICKGEMKIENLKKVSKDYFATKKNKKRVIVGDTIYESIQECAKKNFVSSVYCYQMFEGVKPNKLGIQLI